MPASASAHLDALAHRNRLLRARAAEKESASARVVAREAGFVLQSRGANAAPPPRRPVAKQRPASQQGTVYDSPSALRTAGVRARPASAVPATGGAWGDAGLDASTLFLATAGGGKLRVGRSPEMLALGGAGVENADAALSPIAATAAALAGVPAPARGLVRPSSSLARADGGGASSRILPGARYESTQRKEAPSASATIVPKRARVVIKQPPAAFLSSTAAASAPLPPLLEPKLLVAVPAVAEAVPASEIPTAIDGSHSASMSSQSSCTDNSRDDSPSAGGLQEDAAASSLHASMDSSMYAAMAMMHASGGPGGEAGRAAAPPPAWLAHLYALKRDIRALKRAPPASKRTRAKSTASGGGPSPQPQSPADVPASAASEGPNDASAALQEYSADFTADEALLPPPPPPVDADAGLDNDVSAGAVAASGHEPVLGSLLDASFGSMPEPFAAATTSRCVEGGGGCHSRSVEMSAGVDSSAGGAVACSIDETDATVCPPFALLGGIAVSLPAPASRTGGEAPAFARSSWKPLPFSSTPTPPDAPAAAPAAAPTAAPVLAVAQRSLLPLPASRRPLLPALSLPTAPTTAAPSLHFSPRRVKPVGSVSGIVLRPITPLPSSVTSPNKRPQPWSDGPSFPLSVHPRVPQLALAAAPAPTDPVLASATVGITSPLALIHQRVAAVKRRGAAMQLPPLAHVSLAHPLLAASLVAEDDILAATTHSHLHAHLLQQLGVDDDHGGTSPVLPSPRPAAPRAAPRASTPSSPVIARALFMGANTSTSIIACSPSPPNATLSRTAATSQTYIPAPPSPPLRGGVLLAATTTSPYQPQLLLGGSELLVHSPPPRGPSAFCDHAPPLVIPTLPTGSILSITILSNWGDAAWVGLMGLELFSAPHGGRVEGTRVSLSRADALPLQGSLALSGDPRADPSRLVLPHGMPPSCDDLHSWLHPWTPGESEHNPPTLSIVLGERPVALACVRVWNYNCGGRTHSFRGVRRVRLAVDGSPIYEGDIKRALGRLAQGVEDDMETEPPVLSCAETLLFTDDTGLLDVIAEHDPHAAPAAAYIARQLRLPLQQQQQQQQQVVHEVAATDPVAGSAVDVTAVDAAPHPLDEDLDDLIHEFAGINAPPAAAPDTMRGADSLLAASTDDLLLPRVGECDSLDGDVAEAYLAVATSTPCAAMGGAQGDGLSSTPCTVATPGREGCTLSLATLPLASTLTLAVLSNWGDKHHAGLARIEVLVASPLHDQPGMGRVTSLLLSPASVWARPRDLNDEHCIGGSGAEAALAAALGDPRSLDCLVAPRNCDGSEWLVPLPPSGEEGEEGSYSMPVVTLHLGSERRVAGLRIWNHGCGGGGDETLRGVRHAICELGGARVSSPLPASACDLWPAHATSTTHAATLTSSSYDVLTLRRACAQPLGGGSLALALAQHLDFEWVAGGAGGRGTVRLLSSHTPGAALPPHSPPPASEVHLRTVRSALLSQAYQPPLLLLPHRLKRTPSASQGAPRRPTESPPTAPVGLCVRLVLHATAVSGGSAHIALDSLAIYDAAGQRVTVRPWQVLLTGEGGGGGTTTVLARGLAHDAAAAASTPGATSPRAAPCPCVMGPDGTATLVVLLDAPVGISLVRLSGAPPFAAAFLYLDDFPMGFALAGRHGMCTLALAPIGAGGLWQVSDVAGIGGEQHVALFNDGRRC